MSKEKMIEIAKQAGFTVVFKTHIVSPYGFEDADLSEELSNFYDLAIMKERESLAVMCETWFDPMWDEHNKAAQELARAIRARN